MTRPGITLIGAGLTGSLLSIYLARRGFEVTIYEKRPDPRTVAQSAGRSINLALANRGLAALDEIGLERPLRRVILPMAGRMLHDEAGRLRFMPYGRRPEEVIYSVSRPGLNRELMSLAEAEGVRIQFGHECLDVDFAKKAVELQIKPGQTRLEASFETLIGTDGSASAVRAAILRETRGVCRETPLEHGYKELMIPSGGNGAFRMAENALHIWPRGEFMMIALPNIDGSFTVTLFLPILGEMGFESLTTPEATRAFFERFFPDAPPLMPDYAEQFLGNPLGRLSTVRCAPWHHESALLLGDAAHAIVPFHGQGMNCGFEDCSALNACLDRLDRGWSSVFREFEALRKPNAEAIADMALENYVEMRSSVLDPRFQLKKELSFKLEARFPGRFIPRYSMVMFHRIPYAEAQRRGAVQETILEALVDDLAARGAAADGLDFDKAAALIGERLESPSAAS